MKNIKNSILFGGLFSFFISFRFDSLSIKIFRYSNLFIPIFLVLSVITSSISFASNYALKFDGVDDKVIIPHAGILQQGKITVEAWVQLHSTADTQVILSKGNDREDGSYRFYLQKWDTMRYVGQIGHYSSGPAKVISSSQAANQWDHLALTYDGTALSVYLNGNYIGAKSAASIPMLNQRTLNFGFNNLDNYEYFFNGLLDEVRIWNYARSQQQIQSTMITELTGSETGLIAYYNFNTGSGSTLLERSGNSNNGTIYGAVWAESTWQDQYLHPLTVSSGEGGVVIEPGEGVLGPYAQDEVVSVIAQADPGYSFTNWSGTCDFSNTNETNTSVTMSTACTAHANFSLDQYNVTISSTGGGSVTTPGEGQMGPYTYATSVSIEAQADPTYQFVNWTGTCSVSAQNDPTISILINNSCTLQANFSIKQYTLDITSSSGGIVTIPGEGSMGPYDHGTQVSLTAEENAGYHFVNWEGTGMSAGKVADANSISTSILMDANYSVQANFLSNTTLSFSPTVVNVNTGGNFTVNLIVNNTLDLYGHEVDVSFDSTKLQVVKVTQGNFLTRDGADSIFWLPPAIDNLSGTISNIVGVRMNRGLGVSNTGILASIEFVEKQNVPDDYTTSISFNTNPSKLSNHDAQEIVSSQFTNVEVLVNQLVPLKGDLNSDGIVNLQDLIVGLNILTNQGNSSSISSGFDVDDDDKVTMSELIYIMQEVSGPQ